MFVPKLYRNENKQEVTYFIQKNNFGILVNQRGNGRIVATHIPFISTEINDNLRL